MSKGMRMLAIDRTMRNNRNGMRNETGMNRMGYGNMNNGGQMNMGGSTEMRDNPNMRGYDRDRRGRFTGEMEMNRTYEYGPKSNMEMRGGYDMEGRFPDRRRQEHGGSMRQEGGMESRWTPPYYGDPGMGMDDSEQMRMGGNGGRMEGEMEERNPVGFAAHFDAPGKTDASYQRMEEGKANFSGQMEKGGAKSKHAPKFSRDMAEEWTKKLKNADGSKGPHWTLDQAKQAMRQYDVICDPYEFWAVLNAIYSDDSKVAQKHGVNTLEYYVDRAMAWIYDKDANEGKAALYFTTIVKH